MIEFHTLTAEALWKRETYLSCQTTRFCDHTPGTIFMWRGMYENMYAICGDALVYKALDDKGRYMFSIPLGCGRVGRVMDEVEKYAQAHGMPLIFWAMTEFGVERLKEHFGEEHVLAEAREEWYDYLYHAEDMRTFAGRKFSGQRNHINRFRREYGEPQFEVVTGENLDEVKEFFDRCSAETDRETEEAKEEDVRARELLDYIDVLRLDAGILRVDGRIIGLSIGERLNDTLYVHVERANREYLGSYQVLVNEYAKCFATEEILYVNREEDDGQEGLRRSKQSYHPCELLKKYKVEIQ